MKELAAVRPDIEANDWFHFYIDKPEFGIDFVEDSVVIPLEFDLDLPKIVITINGKEFVFLLDTGCDKTIFGKKITEHLSEVNCDNSNEVHLSTLDGTAMSYNCFLPQLDLGDIKVNNFPILRLYKDELRVKELLFITTFQCDGIIGWDLLHRFDFTIDYKNAQLVLRKPVKKEVKNRNLFWYQNPLIRFYTENNFPIVLFFDTGCNMTYFNADMFVNALEVDKDELKSSKRSTHGVSDWVKRTYYHLPNFNIFTISDNTVNRLAASSAVFQDLERTHPIYLSGRLGSDWFADKAIRVDMLNGIFEISE